MNRRNCRNNKQLLIHFCCSLNYTSITTLISLQDEKMVGFSLYAMFLDQSLLLAKELVLLATYYFFPCVLLGIFLHLFSTPRSFVHTTAEAVRLFVSSNCSI